MSRGNSKSNLRWATVFVVGVMLVAAVVALFVKVNKNETTKTLNSFSYQIGMLSDATGELGDPVDKTGISTKDYYDYEGLNIKVAEGKQVTYYINFYSAKRSSGFLGVKEYSGDFDASKVTLVNESGHNFSEAKYVRIEIKYEPDASASNETVEWNEVYSLSGLLTVTVKK